MCYFYEAGDEYVSSTWAPQLQLLNSPNSMAIIENIALNLENIGSGSKHIVVFSIAQTIHSLYHTLRKQQSSYTELVTFKRR